MLTTTLINLKICTVNYFMFSIIPTLTLPLNHYNILQRQMSPTFKSFLISLERTEPKNVGRNEKHLKLVNELKTNIFLT